MIILLINDISEVFAIKTKKALKESISCYTKLGMREPRILLYISI